MIFHRIVDSKLYNVYETDKIGFNSSDASYIPDEYLEQQNFVIMRTAHGIGDWGILSAMPRLLKTKYPDSKVYIPSEKLIAKLFGTSHNNAYNVFNNNPYIDGFIDSVEGDVFHDQYRIYDEGALDTPLLEQMLKFWQFDYNEYHDSQPEMYWSDQEKEIGDNIIKEHTNGDFGCLLISERFGTQNSVYDSESYSRDTRNITQVLHDNNIPYFYWSHIPLHNTPFNFIDKALDLQHVDLRIQLYIKSRAQLNVSNQCGTNHLAVRYSDVYESQRQYPLKHNFIKGINYISHYEPIDVDYFLNMELQQGGGGKEVCHQDGKLITVRDVVNFFRTSSNIEQVEATLAPNNWQYYNCMMAEFRHGVKNHHELGWENMTKQYYESLDSMTDKEIELFLKHNPVEFDNGFIRHNYHRACAMIGRLIKGKPYIPFYMKTSQIYAEPRKHDNKHRVKPLTSNIYGIKEVLKLGIPASEFTITQSGILALMGIRTNGDIDIIISSKIRREMFNNNINFIRLPGSIEIFEPNRGKFLNVAGKDDDDLITNHSMVVDGVRFLHPKFYFSRKRKDRETDKQDWYDICRFFQLEKFKGYPYNTISLEQWGYEYIKDYTDNK